MPFRNPVYLDTNLLVPLANYHGIEVMTDVAITSKSQETTGGGGEAGVNIHALQAKGNGSRQTQNEVTEARTVKDHPVSAFNHLMDQLELKEAVITSLENGVSKRDLVELDSDWEVSELTSVGAMLDGMLTLMFAHPELMESSDDMPASLVGPLVSGEGTQKVCIIEGEPDDEVGRLVGICSGDGILASLDDLEGDRTVLAQVEQFVTEGADFNLERFLLPSMNRAMRRRFAGVGHLTEMASAVLDRKISAEDLKVPGPASILRVIAIY